MSKPVYAANTQKKNSKAPNTNTHTCLFLKVWPTLKYLHAGYEDKHDHNTKGIIIYRRFCFHKKKMKEKSRQVTRYTSNITTELLLKKGTKCHMYTGILIRK